METYCRIRSNQLGDIAVKSRKLPVAAAFISCFVATQAAADVKAKVVRLVDAEVLVVEVQVRVRGIRVPQIGAKCDGERETARRAKAFAQVAVGRRILLDDLGPDRLHRLIADIKTEAGEDLGEMLIEKDLARPYKSKKRNWC